MMESTSLALNAATKRWVSASIAALPSLVPAASAAQTSVAAPLRARAVSAAHDDLRMRFMRSPPYYSAATGAPLCTPAGLQGQCARPSHRILKEQSLGAAVEGLSHAMTLAIPLQSQRWHALVSTSRYWQST